MRNILRLFAVVGLLLLITTPALAQGQLFFRDDANRLDQNTVEQAAAPLVQRGARVAIYTANNGDQSTFEQYLINDELAQSNGQIRDNLIAIFVGFGSSYSAIRYGDDYASALGTNNRYEQIRANDLNSQLRANNPTQGVVDALESINTAIGAPASGNSGGSSLPSGGVQMPAPATDSGGNAWPWLLGGAALVGGGALAYNSLRKRQGAQKTVRSAREGYEQARKQAGAAIADALALFQDAREKAQYDRVSYTAADLEQITAQQQQAEATYQQAQERFATVEDAFRGRTPNSQEYEQATQTYNEVVTLVQQATEQLAPANARRTELDKINAAAPEAIARAQQAAAAVAERTQQLGEFRNPRAVTREVDVQIAQAEGLLQNRQGAQAAQAAQAAETSVQALAQTVERFGMVREAISNGRAAAQQVVGQGFRVEAGIAAFDQAEAALEQAATALETQGSQAATILLDQADALTQEGIGRGGGMPALRRENEARFAQTEQAGNQLPAYIEQGRAAFDAVDEYAPSTWNDIRGNGSEAQAAAARAKTLWERARSRNTMEAQDFYGAKQDLDAAKGEIDRARTLIDSILQRQKDLQAAQNAARKELAMAQTDIERGWQFVRANDADISEQPEDTLHQAEELLRQASAESSRPKPDWIALVKQAQEANRLADEALAAAQGESTAMGKLREQVDHARQLALGETQRLTQFAQLHPIDLSPQTTAAVQQIQQQAQQAERAAAQAEQTAEEGRAQALRDVQQRYTAVAESAGQVYQQAYSEFQSVEQVRSQVNAEAQRAALAIQQAERTMQTFSSYIPRNSEGIQLLERAHALLRSIGTVRTEQEAQQAIANAQEAERNAESADRLFRSYGNMSQPGGYARGGGAGDFMGGLIIGSMLGGGGHHHHGGGSGWGGSWGGSSGGGGFGGGGGGGWGSGGGGGGDWGGGGGGGGGGW